MTEGQAYGYGLFETIRFQNGKCQGTEAHYSRLKASCKALDIDFDWTYEAFNAYIETILKENVLATGLLRFQINREGTTFTCHHTVRENRYTKHLYKKGFSVGLTDSRKSTTSFLVYHKSINYLENLLVLKDGKKQGYDEMIFLNEYDQLTEGTYTNIFTVKNGVVFTPDIKCGLLKGTMREQVIGACEALNLPVAEALLTKESLHTADEIFLTNAAMGIMPVSKFEGRIFDMNRTSTTQELSKYVMFDWIIE